MDPTGIAALIAAIGLLIDRITQRQKEKEELKETKRRLILVEQAQADCLKRDQQREIEAAAMKAEHKTVTHLETVLTNKNDSDRRFIKAQFDGLTATYDLKKKRITHIEKTPPAGETIGDA